MKKLFFLITTLSTATHFSRPSELANTRASPSRITLEQKIVLKVGGCPPNIVKKIEADVQQINVPVIKTLSKFITDNETVFIPRLQHPQDVSFPLVRLHLRFFPGCVVKDFSLNCADEHYQAIYTPIEKITMQTSDQLSAIKQKHTVPSSDTSPIEIFLVLKIFGKEIKG
jgi:hypothetical protein